MSRFTPECSICGRPSPEGVACRDCDGTEELHAQLSASEAACAALLAERDALRSLLVRARPHVYSDALDLEAWADGVADELAKAARAVVADIDAALKEKS